VGCAHPHLQRGKRMLDRLATYSRRSHSLGALPQGGSVLIENLDIYVLDFVLWYHFNLRFADGVELKGSFNIGKAYALIKTTSAIVLCLGPMATISH
jgi:hypothetical protein